jgi:glycosyltransferase involved in cell wall biosynthesis
VYIWRWRLHKLERNFNHFYLLEARLAPEQMAAIWWRTRLFLATPLFDGYSSALAEGRYVGAIPVVNAIPAHRELLTHQHNAWYVAPLTVQGLVNALATLLQDSAAWQARLAQPNQAWIQANGMLQPNATAFLALAESLLWHYRGRY